MRDFAGYTCPPGYYNLICEVTDSQSVPQVYDPIPDNLRKGDQRAKRNVVYTFNDIT